MPDYAMTWGERPTSDDKIWAVVAHLSVFLSTFIGPLLVILIFQDKSKFIKYHAVQALVFQVVMVVAAVVVSIITTITCGFGGVLYVPLMFGFLVPLYGAYVANDGKWEGLPGASSVGRS